jgi:hypothetical protein
MSKSSPKTTLIQVLVFTEHLLMHFKQVRGLTEKIYNTLYKLTFICTFCI